MGGRKFPFEFATLTQLGGLLDVSANNVGRRLRDLGFRDARGEPTSKAREAGMVQTVDNGAGRSFWVWHFERTMPLLEGVVVDQDAGDRPEKLPAGPVPPSLTGPFTLRGNDQGGDGFELVDASGVVAIWARGRRNAEALAVLLTLASKHGKL